MHISYAELIASGLPLSAADAAALVNGAAAARDRQQRATLPRPEHILLHANGTVTSTVGGSERTDDPVRALAALLYALLRLDRDGAGPRQAEIPGALMLMLARVRGEIDLPAPSLKAFCDVLRRIGSAEPVTLAAIYNRIVPTNIEIPRRAGREVVEPFVAPVAVQQSLRHRRGNWLAPAASFVAGCAVALTFLASTGWNPGRTSGGPPTIVSTRAQQRPTEPREPSNTPGAVDTPVFPERDRTSDRQVPPNGAAAGSAATTGVAAERIDHAPTPLIARTLATDAFSPSFATDGELLFHLGRTDGRLMKASVARDGAVSVTPLVEDAAANFHGAMSPDGTRLAFDSDRDGTRSVYVAEADGTAPRRVSGEGFATTPSWSPDGTRLAFVKSERGHARVWNVWIADLKTGRLTRVSRHRVGQAWRPSWFPDGKRLAYSVEDDLIVTDLVRQKSRLIRSPEPGRLVRTPAVSPDGRRVVFQVFGDGVWLFDLGSGTMHRVLADRTAEEFAWSPDGKRIAFHARRVGRWSLWQLAL